MTCITCRHVFVSCPYPIEDRKEPVSSFRQSLVPIERDHCHYGAAVFFDDHGILLPAYPAEQGGELLLSILGTAGLYHEISSVMMALRLSVHRVCMRIQGKFGTIPNSSASPFPNSAHDGINASDAATWHLLRQRPPPCYGTFHNRI